MIELYVNLVIAKKRTCDPKNKKVRQVPERLKMEVLEALKEEGYDKNGDPIK